jgi:hypothetical protein
MGEVGRMAFDFPASSSKFGFRKVQLRPLCALVSSVLRLRLHLGVHG